MRVGYSFWGFLGSGIVDTPDGGRSHRRILIDGLTSRGHEVVFLQANRDLDEAGQDLTAAFTFDAGLPEVDILFCEWRWPIPGRNTTTCAAPGHTCDLHRQAELLDHYTHVRRVPTVIWDKDRQLATSDPLRRARNVTVCEAALYPSAGAISLLFPVADAALENADAATLAAMPRDLPLVYVGNQYDRDDAFSTFFAPAATAHPHLVAGKWTRTDRWPHVRFTGRVGFDEVGAIHRRTVATMLLLPDRYVWVAQVTQRLFEAVLAGCLPLTPMTLRSAQRFTPLELHIANGGDATKKISYLRSITGTAEHAALIAGCLRCLDRFRLSRQLDILDEVFAACSPTGANT